MSYRIKASSKGDSLDEIHLLSGIERFLLVLQEQRRAFAVGLAVLLMAAAVIAGIMWYDHQIILKARELDEEATRHYLNRPADDPRKAREQLLLAVSLYRQVVEQYPRTPVAPLALFHLGNAQVLNNEVDAGIETFKRFMLLYSSNESLLGLVQQRLAYAYLVKGDRDQAAKAFSGVLQLPGALTKDHVLFELAKMEESQSRPEGALAHYQDLMKNYPNSPFTSEAAVRVKVLEAKKSPESQPADDTPASTASTSTPQPESPAKSSGKPAAATSKKKP